MALIVYFLCMLTSFACAIFLYRGYYQTKYKLLLWSSLGFSGFALNNFLLFIDILIVPQYDLSLLRTLPSMIGMTILAYGLISEST